MHWKKSKHHIKEEIEAQIEKGKEEMRSEQLELKVWVGDNAGEWEREKLCFYRKIKEDCM